MLKTCWIAVLSLALCIGVAHADTYHFTDGKTMEGDIVSMDDQGMVMKKTDGSYSDRIPWTKFSQADLKALQDNPKASQFVGPYIEQSQQDIAQKTEIEIKDVPRLDRPAKRPLMVALFTSGVGVLIFLMAYGGNLYAAWEIAVFRARPPALVCGISAVTPFIGPIIFLSMPHQMKKTDAHHKAGAEEHIDGNVAAAIAAEEAATAEQSAPTEAAPAAPVSNVPPPKIFPRGQFTFNRRFFETQMPGFFAIHRPEADKDRELLVKAARGTYLAQRIVRIAASDMYLQVTKGNASEEVLVPFVEIQEVVIKHKDA